MFHNYVNLTEGNSSTHPSLSSTMNPGTWFILAAASMENLVWVAQYVGWFVQSKSGLVCVRCLHPQPWMVPMVHTVSRVDVIGYFTQFPAIVIHLLETSRNQQNLSFKTNHILSNPFFVQFKIRLFWVNLSISPKIVADDS